MASSSLVPAQVQTGGGASEHIIEQEVLFSRMALTYLQNSIKYGRKFTRGKTSEYLKDTGGKLNIKLPYRTKIGKGRTLVKQPLVDEHVPMSIDYRRHWGVEMSDVFATLDRRDTQRYIHTGALQLGQQADEDCASALDVSQHTFVETAGLTLSRLNELRSYFTRRGIPAMDRCAMLNPIDSVSVNNDIIQQSSHVAADRSLMVNMGSESRYGWMIDESNNTGTHTTGKFGGTITVSVGDTGDAVPGKTITLQGFAASTTGVLRKGDSFNLAGVRAVNPTRFNDDLHDLQTFVVLEDANSAASGKTTVKIYPEIVVDGSTRTRVEQHDGTASGTTSRGAYRTVALDSGSVVADNTSVTMLGDPSTTYNVNHLFHKEAALFVPVMLYADESAHFSRVTSADSGLSVLLSKGYEVEDATYIKRLDVLFGAQLIRNDLAARVLTPV